MPPRIIIAGNWKMNTSLREAEELARELRHLLEGIRGVESVLCPPFPYLPAVKRVLAGSSLHVGAQNMHHEEKGAYTGEVSPPMVAELCEYVILGHSERRLYFGEDDALINKKVNAALKFRLRPILCVGETREQRQRGEVEEVVRRQVHEGLRGVADPSTLAIAYEPVWAIGTGISATPETAREVMEGVVLRALAATYDEHVAQEIPLLYGGSVTAATIEGFAVERTIRGALVGGASLRASEFAEIVRKMAKSKGLR
ncbi:MAG: triose-phosphate isomerase [Chloroflexi bacterium]|nr:triose-phosphate isomerase [Chloroflexota bacterium]